MEHKERENARTAATEIVQTLREQGYAAYFAGGWVRDLLLGIPNDDIDIATSASPDAVHALFSHSVLVGMQFGVVIVRHKKHQFEVATFRQDQEHRDGRRPSVVSLQASLEEDAERRDFTINGMFFDPIEGKVIDSVGGKLDLEKKCLRTIGDPRRRFEEDKLRMIRAVRFANRFGFTIDPATKKAICEMASQLFPAVSMERIWQEFEKMRKGSNFVQALVQMHELKLLQVIFEPLVNIPVDLLKQRVQGLDVLRNVPTILFLLHLFSPQDAAFYKQLHYYLRASAEDGRWIEHWMSLSELLARKNSLSYKYEWVKAFADSKTQVCLEVLLAHKNDPELKRTLDQLFQEHQFHVEKIRSKSFILRAHDLRMEGISPGEKMGKLLEEANFLAVMHDIKDRDLLMQKLKESPLWK